MIVEFVGCTGAGKTTLARELSAQLTAPTVVGTDIVFDRGWLRSVTNATAANLVQDVVGFPYFLGASRDIRPFLSLSARVLHDHAPSAFDELMNARSIMRRIGMFELARHRARGRTVLIDEGPVLIAYHLFVYSTADITGPEVERFATFVPLPDCVVYVKADVPALVARARTRPDPRRQLAGLPSGSVAAALGRACDVFDRVTAAPRLRDRVVVVDNTASDPLSRNRLVRRLAAQVTALALERDRTPVYEASA